MQTIKKFWQVTPLLQRVAVSFIAFVVLALLTTAMFFDIPRFIVAVMIVGCALGWGIIGTIDAFDEFKYRR